MHCISAPSTGRFQADSVCGPVRQSIPSRPARLLPTGQGVNALVAIRQTSRLSSVFFPFSVIQPSPRSFRRQPAFESSRFSVGFRSCGVGATPLRRWLTSFASATVDRGIRSCVTGLILGGVPLSAPYGFGLAGHSRAPVNEGE